MLTNFAEIWWLVCNLTSQCWCGILLKSDVVCQSYGNVYSVIVFSWTRCRCIHQFLIQIIPASYHPVWEEFPILSLIHGVLGLRWWIWTQPELLSSVFTARCCAQCGIATASRPSVRPSVCLSVTLRYRGHIGWNSSKIISRMTCMGFPLCRLQHHGSTPRGTPEICAGIGVGYGKVAFGVQKL